MAAARSAAMPIARPSVASWRPTTADRGAIAIGAPRDLIIGIEMVLVDGRTAKAGGRVVKNVAGYDLSRLMCGSLGSARRRSRARRSSCRRCAAASRTVVADVARRADDGRSAALALANGPSTPSAIEADGAARRVCSSGSKRRTTRGRSHGAHRRRRSASARRGHNRRRRRRTRADAWAEADASVWGEHGPSTIVKIAVAADRRADVLLDEVARADASAEPSNWRAVAAAPRSAFFFVRVSGDPTSIVSLIANWRHARDRGRGSLVVVSAARRRGGRRPMGRSVAGDVDHARREGAIRSARHPEPAGMDREGYERLRHCTRVCVARAARAAHRQVRPLRLLPADLSELSPARTGNGLAARPHLHDEGRRRRPHRR